MADLATIRIPVDSSDMVRAVKDANRLEGSIKLLEKSFGAGNIGSQQFNKGLLQLKRQYEGLFGSSQKATFEVRRYARSLQEARAAQEGLSGHINQVSTGMNKFGVAAQQTGYQVSDFIVQVQSGANPMVAFSQQATQLAGLLYLLPPATQAARIGMLGFSVSMATATAGLTIIIPLFAMLAMSFFSSSKGTKEADESLKGYENTLNGISSKLKETTLNIEAMKRGLKPDELFQAKLALEELTAEFITLTTTVGAADDDPWGLADRLAEILKFKADLKITIADLEKSLVEQERIQRGINAAEEASRIQNLYKLQLIDEQVEKNKSVHDALLAVQNANYKHIESQKISIGLLIQQYSLYGQIATTAAAIATASQNTQYYKLGTLNKGMMGRAGAKGQGEAVSYSFVEPDKVKKAGATKKDPLAELQKQIALQEELNGKTEAEKKVRQALGDDYSKYSSVVIKGLEDQIQKQMDLEDHLKEQQGLYDTIQSSMEDAFMSMVDGTKSAKDAFKSMAAAIIKELYNVLVVQRIVGSFNATTGTGSGIVGALAGAFSGGSGYVKGMAGRANGGPISAGVPYMVGERGPEMIIPKSSGTVLTNGQTKAALGGASNDKYVVHNNITVTGSDSVMVRQEIAKMIPQISSATKAAMIDAKRRGGQMGNAFR